jgi:hypothetical protein
MAPRVAAKRSDSIFQLLLFDAHHATRTITRIKESEKREGEQIAIHFLDNGAQSSIRADAPV